MPVQTSKYGRAFKVAKDVQNFETIHPELGFHGGIAPNKLPQGYSPSCQNFINDIDGAVKLREGYTSFGTYDFGGPVLGAAEVFDSFGNLCGLAPSRLSLAYIHPNNQVWSELSYAQGTVVNSSLLGVPSGLSTDYWNTATIFEPSNSSMIAVLSNNTDWTKFLFVHSDTTTFSDFTWTDSLVSTKAAADVAAIDDRLVFWNTLSSNESRFPTRLLWSARGEPLDYALSSGAGYEDLKDMVGDGKACVHYKDLLLLFSDQEIWRALPTRDAYAFQFSKIITDRGCPYPRTIAVTPFGVVFLAQDFELYIANENSVQALGPAQGSGPSRIRSKLYNEITNIERAFGVYNQAENRYELYYSTTDTSNGFPTRAIFYNFEDNSMWPQKFEQEISDAFDFQDVEELTTWDDFSVSWDSVGAGWDAYSATPANRSLNIFDSTGSAFRFRSEATNDEGVAIDARWRSPSLNQQDFSRRINVSEMWLDVAVESNSSLSILWTQDWGGNFRDERQVSVTTSDSQKFVPVWHQSQNPQFEIRSSDGQTPTFYNFTLRTSSAGRF